MNEVAEGTFPMTVGCFIKKAVIRRIKLESVSAQVKCDIEDLGGWPVASLIVRLSGDSDRVMLLIGFIESWIEDYRRNRGKD